MIRSIQNNAVENKESIQQSESEMKVDGSSDSHVRACLDLATYYGEFLSRAREGPYLK
jgi:hypothetical protein